MSYPGQITVHVDYDHLGRRTHRYEFPEGPVRVDKYAVERDRDFPGVRWSGARVTIGGRTFLAVVDDNPFMLPGWVLYPVKDWRSWIAFARHHAGHYFMPLRRYVALHCLMLGWIKMNELHPPLCRVVFDRTISGPAR